MVDDEIRNIQKAVQLLDQGQLVAIPTETVYGLAAKASDSLAIESIFRMKERPFFDPLIVHGSDLEMFRPLVAEIPEWAKILANRFWPGPLTMVLPKSVSLNSMICSGLETVGIRIPRHPMTLQVLRDLGEAVAAPSANLFGRTSPTTAAHVVAEFGDKIFVLDGGPCESGIESTVIEMDADSQMLTILRPGLVSVSELENALRDYFPKLQIQIQSKENAPGHLKAHYQPRVPLTLYRRSIPETSAQESRQESRIGILKIADDPRLAARALYADMRRLGESDIEEIRCEWTHDEKDPQWMALWDRLSRAATFIS